jgi:hypothetical protein
VKIQYLKPSRGADQAFVFSEMGVAAKILAQAWDPTWKSEVPVRGERNRRSADKLRRRRSFFSKCVWQQIFPTSF